MVAEVEKNVKQIVKFVLKNIRCLQEKRCMSMPSVVSLSTGSSNGSSGTTPREHRSRMLRMQDRRFRHRFASQLPEDERLLN
ncbi:hypothetical protein JTE90_028445, partial [Oedothorax gibbosus]